MRVLVVGGSVAGLAACEALRKAGYDREIVLISAETTAPYDRPPLSKQILLGSFAPEDILLRETTELDVIARLGVTASSLDLADRRVALDSGEEIAFDGLILATGSRARRLPAQADVPNVRVLRTLEDALAVRDALRVGQSLIVVGAGFIGLEVASSARSLGCEVTVLEGAAHPMSRVLPPEIGDLFVALHRRDGASVRCKAQLEEICIERGRASGVRLHDGTRLSADLIVVGVGAIPNADWLRNSGLDVGDGVICDATLRAAERVYACGDVARWPHPNYGSIRVEHWTTAVEHGRTAASNLAADLLSDAGPRAPADAIPYFWSDQCGVKVQLAGLTAGADLVHTMTDGDRFVALFGRGDDFVAAMSIDWPRLLALYRRRIAAGVSFVDAISALPATGRRAEFQAAQRGRLS